METKFLSLILLSVILLSAAASALVTVSVTPSTVVFTESAQSVNFTVTNSGNETAEITMPSTITIDGGVNNIQVTLDKYLFNLTGGSSETVTATVNSVDFENLEIGIDSVTVNIAAKGVDSLVNSTKTMTFKAKKSYCEFGPLNNSVLDIRDVEESGSSSEDDWTWRPQDEITLSISVKNNDNDNSREARVQWDIYDTEANEFLDVGEDDSVSIDEDEEETIEFTFNVPYDLERGSRYVLYVKAYDDDDGEDEICTSVGENGKSVSIEGAEGIPLTIEREKNDVVVTKTNIPETITCGSTADIELWIANIGRAREDKIKVSLLDSPFGENLSREISKLDWDDKASRLTFPITVPKDMEEGVYKLKFRVDYGYDNDEFNDLKTETYDLNIAGNCQVKENLGALVSADLGSEAIAGKELIIKGSLKNTGDARTTYLISAIDYNSWAELGKIEPSALTLEKGETKEFLIYLNVNEDASGENAFSISVDFGDTSEEQEVSVVLEEQQGTNNITGDVITENLRENWFIWVIVIINVVLIIAIILVARRIVAK